MFSKKTILAFALFLLVFGCTSTKEEVIYFSEKDVNSISNTYNNDYNVFTTDTNASTACDTNELLGGAATGCVNFTGWDVDTDSNCSAAGSCPNIVYQIDINGLVDKNVQRNAKVQFTDINAVGIADISFLIGQSTLTINDTNLVGYWQLDEGASTTANDSSRRGNNGTLTNFACTTLDCNSLSGWINNGRIGRTIRFDGGNDFVSFGTASSLIFGSNPFTLSAWIYPAGLWSGERAIFCGTAGFPPILKESGSKLMFGKYGISNAPAGSQNIPTNQWVHVAMSYDGASTTTNNLRYYINGALDKSVSFSTTAFAVSMSNIGSCNGAFSLNGFIDEAMVFDKNLSAKEVKQLYTAQKIQASSEGRYARVKGDSITDLNVLVTCDVNYLKVSRAISNIIPNTADLNIASLSNPFANVFSGAYWAKDSGGIMRIGIDRNVSILKADSSICDMNFIKGLLVGSTC